MRNKTREKLFPEHLAGRSMGFHELFYVETDAGNFSLLALSNGKTIIVHEYLDEKDGFEVYIQTAGNSVDDTRAAMWQ